MKKQNLFIGLAVIIIIVLVVIFSHKGEKAADDHILTVGAALPLSGPTAQFGEIFKDGLEKGLAGDPNIKVIYEDSKGDATGATAAFQKLVTVDHVDLVISNLSKPSVPLVPLAKQSKVPLLFSLVAAQTATNKDNDYAYRIFWTTEQTGNSFADRVIEQGIKSVAVLQAKDEASQLNADTIIPRLEAAGIKVTYETFQGTDTDFRTQLLKVKEANPDVLAIITVPAGQWKNLVTQIHDAGISKPIYDVLGVFLNPGTPEALGDLANGVYTITTPFALGDYHAEEKAEIIKATGKEPAGYTPLGYDTASMLKQMVAANATDRSSIVNFLKGLKSFDGITSTYTVDDSHNISAAFVRAQFVNGKTIKSDK